MAALREAVGDGQLDVAQDFAAPGAQRARPDEHLGIEIVGEALLLSSIAAVIIGGVCLFGGRGTVVGTIIGALLIAVLITGLVMLNAEPLWQVLAA